MSRCSHEPAAHTASNAKSGNGAGRKPGGWKSVAAGRSHIQRDLINGNGLSNIPKITDVGSAAYRRMKKAKGYD